ncbi:MAG: anti-sigma factor antagonist, partial [Clostridia bacterium]|nr:anti-sigma factor antagonist [Clostridia bacterium]
EKRTIVVNIREDLDHHVATELRKAVDAKIKSSNAINVIFDFSKVEFMDSSGIGVIMGRYKITKILGGKVVIFGVKKQVRRIIEMSGIDKLIVICDTLDEALQKI